MTNLASATKQQEETRFLPCGVRVIGDKVLVKPDEVEKTYGGGLIIPDSSQDRELIQKAQGTVVAIGSNCFERWDHPWDFAVGDRVLFGQGAGQQFTGKDDQTYRLLNDNDIRLVIEPGFKVDLRWKK